MDFMSGGDMFTRLKSCNTFDEKTAKFYIAEIILALEFLHTNNVIYRYLSQISHLILIRDLKPENVLID